MKVDFISSKIVSNNLSNLKKDKITPLNVGQTYNNTMKLSNFNSIGASMVSFKANQNDGNGSIDLSKMSIQELQDLKQTYTADRTQQEAKKKDSQEKLDKIKDWDYSSEYQKQSDEAAAEINRRGLSTFWNPFQCKDIRSNHYNDFLRRSREIDDLKSKKDLYEQIVSMSTSDVQKNKTFVSQIDIMIAQKQQIEDQERRLRGIEGINKAIEAMGNAQGGLDDRIGGYDFEKEELRNAFIKPLAKSQTTPTIKVPSAVLLYGANGTGKTTFIESIATEAAEEGYAEVVKMPPSDNAREFKDNISRIFHDAKVRYLEPGDDNKPKRVRTILLINDAERFFSMSHKQAKAVYEKQPDLIDAADEARLSSVSHDHTIIDDLKSALDDCAGVPSSIKDESLNNAAATIFITTNYPHLIDRDLLRKFSYIAAINPAKDKNMEEVMKFYFKRCSDVIDAVKDRAKDPDFDSEDFEYLVDYLSDSSISKLNQMANNGTIQDLKIPHDTIPYENIARDFRPTTKTGAFDNNQLQQLATQALNAYIHDPLTDYSGHYYNLLFNTKRMLDPVRYKHQINIFNTLAPLNKQEGKEDRQKMLEEKILLYRQEQAGIISNRDKKKLDYIKAQDSQELNYLQTKNEEASLAAEEQARLDSILEEQRIIQEELANLNNLSNYEDDEDF